MFTSESKFNSVIQLEINFSREKIQSKTSKMSEGLPAVPVPDVEEYKSNSDEDTDRADSPHADEEREGESAQHAAHHGPVLWHLIP